MLKYTFTIEFLNDNFESNQEFDTPKDAGKALKESLSILLDNGMPTTGYVHIVSSWTNPA